MIIHAEATCGSCGEPITFRIPVGDTAPGVERAVAELAAAAKDGKLSGPMDALGRMAIDLARAMDATTDDRAMAAMAKELRATLTELETRAEHDPTGDKLQARLSTPVGHPTQPKPANAGPASRRRGRAAGPPMDAMATPGS